MLLLSKESDNNMRTILIYNELGFIFSKVPAFPDYILSFHDKNVKSVTRHIWLVSLAIIRPNWIFGYKKSNYKVLKFAYLPEAGREAAGGGPKYRNRKTIFRLPLGKFWRNFQLHEICHDWSFLRFSTQNFCYCDLKFNLKWGLWNKIF